MTISLVIPCFNEEKNIPFLLSKCKEAFDQKEIEVVLVDNGSLDNTQAVLTKLLPNYPFLKVVRIESNQGYGDGILTGLKASSGEYLAWTHADLQTDPGDLLEGMKILNQQSEPEKLFIKGKRSGRPLTDNIFTIGMSFFESLLLKTKMWDINAQPTIFHKSFFYSWEDPPKDFSLDLFAYFMAKEGNLNIRRFDVRFDTRLHGESHWNISFKEKLKFIKRTLSYSFELKKKVQTNA
jgi:glycosyltransferase involved in cell wall biosynthesis